MLETGKVISSEADQVQVRFERTSACARCGACGMTAEQKDIVLTLENSIHAVPGDRVVVEMQTRGMLRASFIAYIVPLLMLIAGVLAGHHWVAPFFQGVDADVVGAITGILLSALAFCGIKLMEPRLRRNKRFALRMVSIQEEQSADEEIVRED